MKFTKEQLSEELKARITNNGKKKLLQSERSFNGQVERIYNRLEKRECEDDLDEVVQEYLMDFEEYEGDFRKINSDHFKEKQEWEKNHPDKKDDKDDKKDDKKDKDKLDLLLEEIQTLKAEREQEKKVKTISEKRNSLKSALKKNGVNDDEWIEDRLQDLHIEKDTDVDSISERWVKAYNKRGAGTPPYITPNTAGGGREDLKHEFDDIAEGLKD